MTRYRGPGRRRALALVQDGPFGNVFAPSLLMACPHCVGSSDCCQCEGTARVSQQVAAENLRWVWDRPGCGCAACVALRSQRVGIEAAMVARGRETLARKRKLA